MPASRRTFLIPALIVAALAIVRGQQITLVPTHAEAGPESGSHPCTACHRFPNGLSHPVGVVPAIQIPQEFPLDTQGRLTCLSCHDVPRTNDATRTPPAFLLRRPVTGRAFCATCHARQERTGVPHVLGSDTAHGGIRFRDAGQSLQPLDEESLNCMGCHDGAIGRFADSAIHDPSDAQRPGASIGFTHPIGGSYGTAALAAPNLRPVASLDQMIRLYSGRLGCGTCHSVYSKHAKHLVMDNRGSRLCIACHNL